jgi:hypothetical protein
MDTPVKDVIDHATSRDIPSALYPSLSLGWVRRSFSDL